MEESHDSLKLYEQADILWEFKNVDELYKDTIEVMNGQISREQKMRQELKILFDLMQQIENCEEKQKKLFEEIFPRQHSAK